MAYVEFYKMERKYFFDDRLNGSQSICVVVEGKITARPGLSPVSAAMWAEVGPDRA